MTKADTLNRTVADNIKRIRTEKRLSLDDLAERSGVSKSMLAQIERGSGNPTLSTMWKIANGMNEPFESLTRREEAYSIVRLSDIEPIYGADGKVRNYPLFPDDESRRFSIFHLEIEPGAGWTSEPHLEGTVEFVTVYKGKIEVTVGGDAASGGESFEIGEKESIRFKADKEHSYRNTGKKTAIVHNILYDGHTV